MPSILLSNPLGADDAERIGLTDIREYGVGELIIVDDFSAFTLIRTGYGVAVGYIDETLIVGDGSPPSNIGADGQWYLDKLNEVLWGPKVNGTWPNDPIRPDRGVAHFVIDANGHLQMTYSTGTTVDLGYIIGPANHVDIGTVTTLPAGSPATAGLRDVGTGAQELDLGLPQGTKGDKGDRGVDGITGPAGQGFGGGLIIGPPDPAEGITATITSPWGLRDDGSAYYDPAGALPAEAALMIPDPASGKFALFRPGASSSTLVDDTIAALLRDGGSDTRVELDGLLSGFVPQTALGQPSGVATLDATGKIPLAELPSSIPTGGGGSGSDQGTISVQGADGSVDFAVTIASNWGVTDTGDVYYDSAGAVAADAGLLVPDPDRNGFAIFRPGGPWPTEDDRVATLIGQGAATGVPASAIRAALDARYGSYWGTGATFPASALLKPSDSFLHTAYGLHFWNGAAWRQRGPHELTQAQRLALNVVGLYAGYQVFETDTGRTWQWTGTTWFLSLGQKPMAVIYDNAGGGTHASTTGGNWTEVALSGEMTDTDNMHAANAARIVAPFDGYYKVNGQINWVSGTAGATTKVACIGVTPGARDALGQAALPGGIPIALGSTNAVVYSNGGTSTAVPTVPRRLWLAAGQWVSLWGYATGTSTLAGSAADPGQWTYLEVTYDGV